MTLAEEWKVTISLIVTNEDALMSAAREACRANGDNPEVCITDTATALRWLLDPGDSPPGTTILDSYADRAADLSGGEGGRPLGSMVGGTS